MPSDYRVETTPPTDLARSSTVITIRIVDKYGDRIPTVKELMDDHGMHRSTAWRWRNAFLIARGKCE